MSLLQKLVLEEVGIFDEEKLGCKIIQFASDKMEFEFNIM
jgi:hypothetical protein